MARRASPNGLPVLEMLSVALLLALIAAPCEVEGAARRGTVNPDDAAIKKRNTVGDPPREPTMASAGSDSINWNRPSDGGGDIYYLIKWRPTSMTSWKWLPNDIGREQTDMRLSFRRVRHETPEVVGQECRFAIQACTQRIRPTDLNRDELHRPWYLPGVDCSKAVEVVAKVPKSFKKPAAAPPTAAPTATHISSRERQESAADRAYREKRSRYDKKQAMQDEVMAESQALRKRAAAMRAAYPTRKKPTPPAFDYAAENHRTAGALRARQQLELDMVAAAARANSESLAFAREARARYLAAKAEAARPDGRFAGGRIEARDKVRFVLRALDTVLRAAESQDRATAAHAVEVWVKDLEDPDGELYLVPELGAAWKAYLKKMHGARHRVNASLVVELMQQFLDKFEQFE